MEVKSDATALQNQRRWTQQGIIIKCILDLQAFLVSRCNIFQNRHLYYTAPLYHLSLRAYCMKLKGGREGRNNILASLTHIECDTHPCVPIICFWERITLLSLEMTDPRKSSSLISSCQQQMCDMKMWREKYHDLLLDAM